MRTIEEIRALGDEPNEVNTITQVTPMSDGNGWNVAMDGCGIWVPGDACTVAPAVGERLAMYCKGLGSNVRGLVIGDRVYRYMTEAEADAAHRAEVVKAKAKRDAEWLAGEAEYMRKVALLPEPFQKRIRYFLSGVPRWGADHGAYELFCCQEAVKILGACKTVAAVKAFYDDHDMQKAVLGDTLEEHSGNTFGAACLLARASIEGIEVWQMHGALCPLVGCDAYGCYASRGGGAS